MAGAVRVVLNQGAIRGLTREAWVRDALMEYAEKVADEARSVAPRRTGAGAESIAAEAVEEASGWTARVAWSKSGWYMRFTNDGTVYQNAQHYMEFSLNDIAASDGGPVSMTRASKKPSTRRRRGSLTNAKGNFNASFYGGKKRRKRKTSP